MPSSRSCSVRDGVSICLLPHILISPAYLRLADVDAKNHPVYRELTRVRQYFEKITATETGTTGQKRENLGLDKKAAARFITSALVRTRDPKCTIGPADEDTNRPATTDSTSPAPSSKPATKRAPTSASTSWVRSARRTTPRRRERGMMPRPRPTRRAPICQQRRPRRIESHLEIG